MVDHNFLYAQEFCKSTPTAHLQRLKASISSPCLLSACQICKDDLTTEKNCSIPYGASPAIGYFLQA